MNHGVSNFNFCININFHKIHRYVKYTIEDLYAQCFSFLNKLRHHILSDNKEGRKNGSGKLSLYIINSKRIHIKKN